MRWCPQPGSQVAFLTCPIYEVLLEGNRGGGKTTIALMKFRQHCGKGWGAAYRGILFRRSFPELDDVIAKSKALFGHEATYRGDSHTWTWPDGEELMFRHARVPEDYASKHGAEVCVLLFEELTAWPTADVYLAMQSLVRSPVQGIPKFVASTTNPSQAGHAWVKARWQLPISAGRTVGPVIREPGNPPRIAIRSRLEENRVLLDADPHYIDRLRASAPSPRVAKAWIEGSWDLPFGGVFEDVWDPDHNVVEDFDVPRHWRIDRAFDWGSSAPFSVGWYARSDGTDLRLKNGDTMATRPGDLFRVREWYGWTGQPNQGLRMLAANIAAGIIERECAWGWRHAGWTRVHPGPADSSIWTVENGNCIATDMQRPVRIGGIAYPGVTWTRADKSSGSVRSGFEMLKRMISAAKPGNGPREHSGLFVIGSRNPQFLRTLPSLPRDKRDPDIGDSDAEDHIVDEVRYRVLASKRNLSALRVVGRTL